MWICQGTQWFSPLPSPANPTERILREERQPTPPKALCAQGQGAGAAGSCSQFQLKFCEMTGLQGVCLRLHV